MTSSKKCFPDFTILTTLMLDPTRLLYNRANFGGMPQGFEHSLAAEESTQFCNNKVATVPAVRPQFCPPGHQFPFCPPISPQLPNLSAFCVLGRNN